MSHYHQDLVLLAERAARASQKTGLGPAQLRGFEGLSAGDFGFAKYILGRTRIRCARSRGYFAESR